MVDGAADGAVAAAGAADGPRARRTLRDLRGVGGTRDEKEHSLHRNRNHGLRPPGIRRLLAALLLPLAASCQSAQPEGQRSFATPEAAADAFLEALDRDDSDALLAVFGPEWAGEIVTPEWSTEHKARGKIANGAKQRMELVAIDEGEVQLVLGEKKWPFPFPLVQEEDTWRFDTAQGLDEIRSRRVGRNELFAIQIARAYVDAQIEYALEDRDGDAVLEYAQRLASSPGQQDGLYWEAGPDEALSPFGPLVQGAEGRLDERQPGDPIMGYYFKILARQGENPPGGAHGYVINGNMVAGFALVAYPARYAGSGVMTFVVSHRGRIHQKDLGEFTGMDAYDPDDTWSEVQE